MTSHFSRWYAGRKRISTSCTGAVLALSLMISTPAHGLSIVVRSFDELVERADLILGGTVKDVHSQFADDGLDQNTIFSYVTRPFTTSRLVKVT